MYSFKKGISKFLVLALLLLQLPVAYADSEQEVDLDISNIGIVESIGEDLDTRDLDQANEDSEDLGEGEKLEDLGPDLDKSIGLDQYEDLDGGQTISGYSAPISLYENGVYHPSTGEELRNLLETGGNLDVEIGATLDIDKTMTIRDGQIVKIIGRYPYKGEGGYLESVFNILRNNMNSNNGNSRIFVVEPGGRLELKNIRLDGKNSGGGIRNFGELILKDVEIRESRGNLENVDGLEVSTGSAIYNEKGASILFEGLGRYQNNSTAKNYTNYLGSIYNKGKIEFAKDSVMIFIHNGGLGSVIYNDIDGEVSSKDLTMKLVNNLSTPIYNKGVINMEGVSSIKGDYPKGLDDTAKEVRLIDNNSGGKVYIHNLDIENGKDDLILNRDESSFTINTIEILDCSENKNSGKYIRVEGGSFNIGAGKLKCIKDLPDRGIFLVNPKEDVDIKLASIEHNSSVEDNSGVEGSVYLVELDGSGANGRVGLSIADSGLLSKNIIKSNYGNVHISLLRNNIVSNNIVSEEQINLVNGQVASLLLENNIIDGDFKIDSKGEISLIHNTIKADGYFGNEPTLKNNIFIGSLYLYGSHLELGDGSKITRNNIESESEILFRDGDKHNILLETGNVSDYANIFEDHLEKFIEPGKPTGIGGAYEKSYRPIRDNSFATGIAKVVLEDNEDMIHNKRDQLHPTFGAIEGKYTRGVYRVRFLDEKGNPIEEEFTEEVDLATEIKIVDSIKDIYGYEYIRTQPSDRLIVSNKTEENIISHYYKNKLSPRLSFHGNGGKFGNGDSIRKFYPKDGDKLATYIPVDLLRSDYDFSNWTLGLNGGKINRDYIIKADDDLHIYANWKKKPDPVKPDPIKPNPDPDPDTKEPEKPDPIKPDPSKPTPKLPEIVPGPGVEDKKITPPDFIEIMFPDIPLGSKLNMVDHFAYIFGYPDSTVRGENNISREEAAAVFYRLLKPSYKELIYSNDKVFTDIMEGRWSFDNISTLNKGGIVSGYPDGNFRPKNNVTRAEIAVMASKFDNLKYDGRNSFSDVEGHWAKHYINSAAMNGWLVGGGSNSNFRPDDYMTRAEFVTMVNRILQRRVRKENALPDLREFKDLKDTSWYYEPMIEAINGHDYQPERLEDGSELWLRLLK